MGPGNLVDSAPLTGSRRRGGNLGRAVILVDANNFYASCERVFDARLVGKPVVVLSNNDGCVIARSAESKKLGIAMGEPFFKVRGLVEEHRVIVRSSNYELYGDMSARLMDVLEQFTPDLEVYSIDEAFLEVDAGSSKALDSLGREIRNRIHRQTGLPVSIGIAGTKTLAKVANHLAKKSTRAEGVLNLLDSPHLDLALERTPVEEVWGVGRRQAVKLQAYGILTARGLRGADDDWVRRKMTVVGLRTVHELRGVRCLELGRSHAHQHSLVVSRSFGNVVWTRDELRDAVSWFTARGAEKLRRRRLAAAVLTVFVRIGRNSRPADGESTVCSLTFDLGTPSDSTIELMAAAQQVLCRLYREGIGYRKAGIMLTGLIPSDTASRRLWDAARYERQRELMTRIDKINHRHGKDTIRCGLYKSAGGWRSRTEQRSDRFTTNWKEIMRVK